MPPAGFNVATAVREDFDPAAAVRDDFDPSAAIREEEQPSALARFDRWARTPVATPVATNEPTTRPAEPMARTLEEGAALTPEQIREFAQTPLIRLPAPPDVSGLPELMYTEDGIAISPAVTAGIYQGAKPLIEGLITPPNLAILAGTAGLGAAAAGGSTAAKVALAGTSAGFGVATAKDTIDLAKHAAEVLADPETGIEERVAAVTQPVLTGGLSAVLLGHGVRGGTRLAAAEAIPRLNAAFPELFWRQAGITAEQFSKDYPAALRRVRDVQRDAQGNVVTEINARGEQVPVLTATAADLDLISRVQAAAKAAGVSAKDLARGRMLAELVEWEPRPIQQLIPADLRPQPPEGVRFFAPTENGMAPPPTAAPGAPPAVETSALTRAEPAVGASRAGIPALLPPRELPVELNSASLRPSLALNPRLALSENLRLLPPAGTPLEIGITAEELQAARSKADAIRVQIAEIEQRGARRGGLSLPAQQNITRLRAELEKLQNVISPPSAAGETALGAPANDIPPVAPPAPPAATPLPPDEKFSRRQIVDQRRVVRDLQAKARRLAEIDPAKAAEVNAEAQAARDRLVQMETQKIQGRAPSVGNAPDGNPDLLTQIEIYVGKIRTVAPEGLSKKGGEYDGWDKVLQDGAARLLIGRETGTKPAEAIDLLNEGAGTKFQTVTELQDAISAAVANRRRLAIDIPMRDYRMAVERALLNNSGRKLKLRVKGDAGIPIEATGGKGAKFEIREEKFSIADVIDDPNTGTVMYVVQDGHKFVVPEGTIIFPDRGEWKSPADKGPQAPTAAPPAAPPSTPPPGAPPAAPPPAPRAYTPRPDYGKANKLVNVDRAAQLREQLRARLAAAQAQQPPAAPPEAPPAGPPEDENPFDPGPPDPAVLQLGAELAVFHVEAGQKAFPAFAEAMIADVGPAIAPYLESLYFSAKHWPGVDPAGMSTEAEVSTYAAQQKSPQPRSEGEPPSGPRGSPQPAPVSPRRGEPKLGNSNRRGDGGKPTVAPRPEGQPEKSPQPPAGPDTAPRQRIVTARPEFTAEVPTDAIPARLRPHLDAHQAQGAASAILAMQGEEGGFLNADGTGVGKTRQEIAVAAYWADQDWPVIIVTKAEAIKPDWKKNLFGGSMAYDAKAMGVPIKLARDGRVKPGEIGVTTYENVSAVADHATGAVLIFDEAHALKNIESRRSIATLRAIGSAKSVLFLSATPADKPLHIHYLARIGIYEGQSPSEALRQLGMKRVEIQRGGRTIEVWNVDNRISGPERLRRFKALFDRMTQNGRMIKREVDMHGLTVEVRRINLPQEALDLMGSIQHFLWPWDTPPQGLKKAQILMHQRRQQETYKIDATVQAVKAELAAGRQVVVFMSRVNKSEVGKWVTVPGMGGMESERIRETLMDSEGTVKLLREALQREGITDIAEIHGNADLNARDEMAAFQEQRKRVMIATMESGGTGINLDDTTGKAPRTEIVMTAPFSAVENVQAAGRIWRLKTQGDARVIYLFADTAIDEWNASIIGSKMKQLGATVQGAIGKLDITDPEYMVGYEPGKSTMGEEEESDMPLDENGMPIAPGMPPIPAGTPAAMLNYGRMPVAMEPILPGQVDVGQILDALREVAATAGSTTAFREGRFYQNALGIAKSWSEIIRLKDFANIPTAAHEIGHIVSKAVFGSMLSKPLMVAVGQRAAIQELTALGRALYGARKPVAGYTAEGFSELVRLWLTTENARNKAPAATAWLETVLFPKPPKAGPYGSLGAAMNHARDLIDIWRGQGAMLRVSAQMKPEPGRVKRLKTWADENLSLQATVEEFAPFEELDRLYQAKTGNRLPPGESPYLIASALRATAGARLETMIEVGMMDTKGNITGPPLREAVTRIKPQHAGAFQQYLFALEAIERLKQSKNPGIAAEDAIYVRDTLQAAHPEFIDAASKWAQWWDGLRQYSIDAYPEKNGPIWARVKRTNPVYYGPLNRVLDPENSRSQSVSAGVAPTLQRFKGTGRPVKELILNSLRVAEAMIAQAHRDMVLRSVVALEQVEGFGFVVEPVPRSRVMEVVNVEKIRRQLEDLGVDLSGVPDDTMLEYASLAEQPSGVDPIIALRLGDTIRWLQVSSKVFDLLSGIQEPARLGAVFELLGGGPARAFRLGTTGLRASFSLFTNPARDLPTFLLQSAYGGNPARMLGAYFNAMADIVRAGLTGQESELLALRNALGLQAGTYLGGDIQQTRREAKGLFRGKWIKRVLTPLETTREIFGFTESIPRLAEMALAARAVGWRPGQRVTLQQAIEMMLAFKRSTTDFTAKGAKWRGFFRSVPFSGAGVQGLRSFLRAFSSEKGTHEAPKAAARVLLNALTGLTLTSLAIWWMNKDKEWWRNLTRREKSIYWNIEHNGTIYQIPTAPEWGAAFVSLPVALADSWYRQDSEGVRAALGYAFDVSNPIDYPVLLKAAKEQWTNRIEFFDRSIVSRSQLNLLPGLQRSPYSSALAKQLGNLFPGQVSPQRFDAAVRQVFGGVGADVLDAPGAFMRALDLKTRERNWEWSDLPVFGRAVRRGGAFSGQAQPLVDFWDDYTRYSALVASNRFESKEVGRPVLAPMNDAERQYAMRLQVAQPFISLRLEIAARTPDLRPRQELYREAARLAADVLKDRPRE